MTKITWNKKTCNLSSTCDRELSEVKMIWLSKFEIGVQFPDEAESFSLLSPVSLKGSVTLKKMVQSFTLSLES